MNDLDVVFPQVRNETAGLLDHARIVEAGEWKVDHGNLQPLDFGSQHATATQRSHMHFKLATVAQQRHHLDHLTF